MLAARYCCSTKSTEGYLISAAYWFYGLIEWVNRQKYNSSKLRTSLLPYSSSLVQ